MRSSISGAVRGGLTAANLGGLSEREYDWVASKTEQKAEERIFFGISFFFLCLFFFLCPICPIFSSRHCCLTLRPFLLRAYQHICLEKLVFPSIFTPCFPKASLDPWTTLLVLFPFRPPWVKNQGVKLKTPGWPLPRINLLKLPEPPSLIRKTTWELMKKRNGAVDFTVAYWLSMNRLIYKWTHLLSHNSLLKFATHCGLS